MIGLTLMYVLLLLDLFHAYMSSSHACIRGHTNDAPKPQASKQHPSKLQAAPNTSSTHFLPQPSTQTNRLFHLNHTFPQGALTNFNRSPPPEFFCLALLKHIKTMFYFSPESRLWFPSPVFFGVFSCFVVPCRVCGRAHLAG